MATSQRPTILLIAGAWHTSVHLQPALAPLRSKGYNVLPLPLPSAGVRNTPVQFDEVVATIRSNIEDETKAGRDVAIIAHSAAGMPSVVAANEVMAEQPTGSQTKDQSTSRGRLTHFIFLASFLDVARSVGMPSWFGFDEATGYFCVVPEQAAGAFYNDMNASEAQKYVDALVLQSPAANPTLEELSAKWTSFKDKVERTYIVCLQDQAVLEANQRLEAQELDMEVVEIDAGHCPFVSKPEEFARCVDGVLTP